MSNKATNFFSWMDEQYRRPSMDEETMAEHDKHYHKGGYNPETDKCEKRELEKDRDSSDSNQPPFTEKMLLDRFGMKVKPFSKEFTGEEKSAFANDAFRRGWEAYAIEPDEASYRETISRVGNVLADLENRFGSKIHIDNILVANLKDKDAETSIGGFSMQDRKFTKESVIVIAANPPEWGGKTYGHSDKRNLEDMIRHEIGHALTTQYIQDKFHDVLSAIRKTLPRETYLQKMRATFSQYALESEMDVEAIAELFSKATDKEYQKGQMDERFEELIFETMLGGK